LQIFSSFQNIFSVLWRSKTPCFALGDLGVKSNPGQTILSNCKWKGLDVPCSAIFSQFPSDKGICCSFNMKEADKIFQGETYVQLVNSLQMIDTEQELDNTSFLGLYSTTQETNPGKSKGLSVIVGKNIGLQFYYILVGPTRVLQVSPPPRIFIFSSLSPPCFWQPCFPLNLATLPPEA
jgi:hypothetical protein